MGRDYEERNWGNWKLNTFIIKDSRENILNDFEFIQVNFIFTQNMMKEGKSG